MLSGWPETGYMMQPTTLVPMCRPNWIDRIIESTGPDQRNRVTARATVKPVRLSGRSTPTPAFPSA